jgi:adenosylcobinamide-GDP ribazoletransferase
MRSFLVALAFMTILPIRFRKLVSPQDLACSRYWYPLVGLLLGAVLGGWAELTAYTGKPLTAAFLILAAWVLFTGALHLDGFCDFCDGVFGGQTREDRLRIMKDPHLGTFGAVGAILLLLGKWVLLVTLSERAEMLPWIVAAAVCVARCLVLVMAGASRYARLEGTGRPFIAARPAEAVFFSLVGVAASLALLSWAGILMALAPFLGSLVVVLALTLMALRRLGGITGDCLGAGIEAAELVFLLTAALLPTETTGCR